MTIFQSIKSRLGRTAQEVMPEVDSEKLDRVKALSPREYEAYLILLEGFTLRYAAEHMGIKYPTANTYVNAIYRKLGVASRAQLIINYRDVKLTEKT